MFDGNKEQSWYFKSTVKVQHSSGKCTNCGDDNATMMKFSLALVIRDGVSQGTGHYVLMQDYSTGNIVKAFQFNHQVGFLQPLLNSNMPFALTPHSGVD